MQRSTRSHPVALQSLESRRLLSAPAQLLATLPQAGQNINVSVDDSLVVNDKLFFTGTRDGFGERLWTTEGGGSATRLQTAVTFDQGISALTNFNGKLYFFANGSAGDGLYVSDGTPDGTQPVKILRPNANVLPQQTFILNNRLYFFWADLGQPVRLWSSDGTAAGTNPIWDLPQGYVQSISPVINGHVFFGAYGQLWRTDGTAQGTVSLWTGPETYNYPGAFATTDDKLYFLKLGYDLRRLYVANLDGTGVTQVSIPTPDSEPWVYDTSLVSLGHRILFRSSIPSSQIQRLFSTDGTDAGTIQLAGGPDGYYSIELSYPVRADDRAVFLETSSTGSGLWSTDGTVAGTQRILARPVSILDAGLFSAGGKAFFAAPSSVGPLGLHIYESDGTAAGTRPIHYLATGTSLTYWLLRNVASYQDRLVLRGYKDGILELWSLDPNVSTGSITGHPYLDLNRNGTREGFEHFYSGTAYIDLDGNDSMDPSIDATSPANDGDAYLFDGLPPGGYTLRLGGNQTMTNPPGNEYQIDLQSGQNITSADFAIGNTSTVIWGTVYEDRNENGVRDADENGVGGQTVWVDLNGDGNPHYIDEPVMETAADGTYGFVVPGGGSYSVKRSFMYQWRQTNPGGLDGLDVSVANGQVANAQPIGIVSDTTPPRAESGSFDVNRNQLRIVFSENIANLISGALKIKNRSTGVEMPSPTLLSFDLATHTALFRLPQSGLPDGDYQAALSSGYGLVDLASNRLVDGFSFDFFLLKGDLNRDRQVNIADFITLSSNFGKTNATYADGDLNYDDQVTIADFIDLASNFNKTLDPPAAAVSPQAASAETISAAPAASNQVVGSGDGDEVLGAKNARVIARNVKHHRKPRRHLHR